MVRWLLTVPESSCFAVTLTRTTCNDDDDEQPREHPPAHTKLISDPPKPRRATPLNQAIVFLSLLPLLPPLLLALLLPLLLLLLPGGAHIHTEFGEQFPDEGLDDRSYR